MFNRLAIQVKVMVISCRNRPARATSSLDRPARSVHQQIRGWEPREFWLNIGYSRFFMANANRGAGEIEERRRAFRMKMVVWPLALFV